MALAPSICGVILAAGSSTRMGRDKALLPWPPAAEHTPAVNTLLGANIDLLQQFADLVVVVAGRNAAEIGPIAYARGAFLVVNRDPEQGQFSSLRVGLQEVLNRGRDAAFIALVDRPPVLPGTVEALVTDFRYAGPQVWAVVPQLKRGDETIHGHPILIGREMMEVFLRAPLDATARDIEHQYRSHILYLDVPDERVAMNLDTPEDYQHASRSPAISAEKHG